ncbi:DUF5709 domain-containing protein [Modestobacter marinus]|uniref:DUF5709 domain-containing protein n=1 Tax=Modestobacter marinus TaxID=477641 RepID=UPI001C98CBFA|nr:DUF5709 domain-containing protein [Modestobacter marinus]
MDPSAFGSDGTDPEEDSGVLEAQDTLEDVDGVADVLDTGWSPAERPWGVGEWGTTAEEEVAGESLTGRLARELPETDGVEGDGLGDAVDTDGELIDDEVGDRRAGRLVEDGEGSWGDVEPELYASDVGIDSAAASAEEAAVHVVPDEGGTTSSWSER